MCGEALRVEGSFKREALSRPSVASLASLKRTSSLASLKAARLVRASSSCLCLSSLSSLKASRLVRAQGEALRVEGEREPLSKPKESSRDLQLRVA